MKDVLKRVEGGNSLAEALGYHPRIFPKLYINMVKAGESGGFLETILSRLAQYLQSTKELREYLISVMIYPLILTFVMGISIILLVTFVIPRFGEDLFRYGTGNPLADTDRSLIQPMGKGILVDWSGDRRPDLLWVEDV